MAESDLDLLTIDEAARACGGKVTDPDLALMVTAVSQNLDDRYGPVVKRPVTVVVDAPGGDLWLPTTPLYLDDDHELEVEESLYGGPATTLVAAAFGSTTGDYRLIGTGHLSRLLRLPYRNWGDQVQLTYWAGRCADTESVPAKFKQAAKIAVNRLAKRERPVHAQGGQYLATQDADVGDALAFYRVLDSPMIHEFLVAELRPPVIA